ncbi:MAG: peptidylprolyl isomerase, partial [Clostridia bacterium]|nr:peptidylprolyl isomerase [Clostridia bacterium]
MKQYETSNPVVAIKIKDYGVVVAELYPDIAPQTVYNFIYLIKNGFYDNNTI